MKRKILILFVLLTIFISGCNSTLKNENVHLQKIDISYIKDEEFLNTIEEVPLAKGIYLIEGKTDKYILLSKIDVKSEESISCRIDNSILQIDIETEGSSNTNVYRILNEYDSEYNLIELAENGKKLSLSTIFLSD